MKSVMRRVVAGGMCVVMLGSTGTAWAQGGEGSEELRTQFLIFEDLDVDGTRGKAMTMRMKGEKASDFGKLARLKKSMLPKLREMAEGL